MHFHLFEDDYVKKLYLNIARHVKRDLTKLYELYKFKLFHKMIIHRPFNMF